MNKKILIVVMLYLFILIVLSGLGYYGDARESSITEALKYFTMTDIVTGRTLFRSVIVASTVYKILAFVLLLFLAYSKRYSRCISSLMEKVILLPLQYIISCFFILCILACVKFPFDFYIDYYTGMSYGLVVNTFPSWLGRYAAMSLIRIVFMTFLFSVIFYTVARVRRYLVVIPVVFFILSIAVTVMYPRYITPLFYDFPKIEDDALAAKISDMAKRGGVEIKDIQVINQSRYRLTANAYLVGFGGERRIVLYDTLLKNFSHAEILSILAHEMCHYTEEHMLIGITLGSAGIVITLLVMRVLLMWLFNTSLRSFAVPERYPLMILMITVLLFFSMPIENSISRFMERRADRYALELTGDAQTAISSQVKLSRMNKSNILPNPVYTWFYSSHPTALERIRTAGVR
jgi:Zn-dependent protease with chaperone function